MAAVPVGGTLMAIGLTGNIYVTELYFNDVTLNPVRFDAGAGASANSQDFVSYPEPVVVYDMIMTAVGTDTNRVRVIANGAPTPNILRHPQHISTISNRPKLSIKLKAGTRLSMIQYAT